MFTATHFFKRNIHHDCIKRNFIPAFIYTFIKVKGKVKITEILLPHYLLLNRLGELQHGLLGRFPLILRGIAADSQSAQFFSAFAGRLHPSLGAGQSAAFVRAEWYHDLVPPVMFLDESIDRHRHFAPPIGIAQENHVIILNSDIAIYFRPGVRLFFTPCHFDTFIIGCRIRFYGFNMEHISPGCGSNHFRDDMRIPFLNVSHRVVLRLPVRKRRPDISFPYSYSLILFYCRPLAAHTPTWKKTAATG